jgi:hypothetical protein
VRLRRSLPTSGWTAGRLPAAAVTVLVAVVLWFALVPHDDPGTTDPRVPAYWSVMVAAAASLGFAFGRPRAVLVGSGLTLPQFVLAFWTAPRGDNDGLWALRMPLLLVFGAVLIVPAWMGGWVAGRRSGPPR